MFSLCRLVNVAEPQAPMAEISYFTEKSGVRQILNMKDATQMYAIDKHQMSEIFCTRKDVANLPAAIYAVAGESRQGKSFLLNVLHLHLCSQDKVC